MDRRKINYVIVCCVGFVLMVTFPVGYFFSIMASPWQGIRQMEEDYNKNKECIILVKDYLIQSEFSSVSISGYTGNKTMFVNCGDVLIDSAKIEEAIEQLFSRGYSSVKKSGNGISFARWSGKDVSKGVVYSIDGCVPDKSTFDGYSSNEAAFDFLTKIEPLAEDGWYYYEEDYNRWEVRNRSN